MKPSSIICFALPHIDDNRKFVTNREQAVVFLRGADHLVALRRATRPSVSRAADAFRNARTADGDLVMQVAGHHDVDEIEIIAS